jgi:hypothetical protein
MNWSRISHELKFLRVGMRAVAQKVHPITQPTCEERHSETEPSFWSGIMTVSIFIPSEVVKRSFSKPSF